MASADTSLLVRLIVQDEPAQARAAARFLEANVPLRISQIALVETLWVLSKIYGYSRADVAETIAGFLESAEFVVERDAEVDAALVLFRGSRADFSDCLLVTGARAAGAAPLATFDRALARLDGALLLR